MPFIKISCYFGHAMEKLFNHPCAIHFLNGPVYQQTTTDTEQVSFIETNNISWLQAIKTAGIVNQKYTINSNKRN